MKNLLTILLATFLFSCQDNNEQLNLKEGVYISNVTIISTEDGTYSPYIGHLVIEKDGIVYVGKNEPSISGVFEQIDGTGKFIIPGLIDSHVHMTEVQGMLQHHKEKYPDLVKEFNDQMPRSYLYYGFTTIINLGGISDERINSFNIQPLTPDLYHVGYSGAAIANGYPMIYTPEEYRFEIEPNFIYVESQAEHIPDKYKPADHTPKAVVKRIKNSGAIAVKSYYESGFGRMSNLPLPTKSIMTGLLNESHANGLVLTVHANSLAGHSFLTDVGVDILAHGLWNWEKYKDVPTDSLPLEIKETLDLQIQKQIGYTPTLTVIEGEGALVDTVFINQPALKKVIPKNLLEWYKTEEAQWFAKDLFGESNVEEVHKIYGNIQAHAMLVLKYLSDHNGLILFGTDTPSGPIYTNQPGYNGYWELKLMKKAEVPLNKILASATINNAKAFHLDSSLGSLAIGKKANLLMMAKNPLMDIEAYDAIDKVVIGGKIIKREDLEVKE
ncbi:amidohydrolase family protein [Maribacter polysiphoniae]|uniref:Amidohydrolase family protein n=1 Tax=Maribacter polysiphoniae TaxID=429344 RepID=A0A316E0N8_9FLAO|nr:amidohydrolase family protein [Maribacter polysiphoniae]MBD1259809.1 amidohydrolase family protein [Maribacter polysiphoniae]PWK23049.1 amidohydrolase family protein [Maribacter polysiphoniae]